MNADMRGSEPIQIFLVRVQLEALILASADQSQFRSFFYPRVSAAKNLGLAGLCEAGSDGLFRLRPDDSINQLSVFENEHCGNALNLKPSGHLAVIINVEFANQVFAC